MSTLKCITYITTRKIDSAECEILTFADIIAGELRINREKDGEIVFFLANKYSDDST